MRIAGLLVVYAFLSEEEVVVMWSKHVLYTKDKFYSIQAFEHIVAMGYYRPSVAKFLCIFKTS